MVWLVLIILIDPKVLQPIYMIIREQSEDMTSDNILEQEYYNALI